MNELSWTLVKGLLPYFATILVVTIISGLLVILKKKAKIKINQKIASIKTDGRVCPRCGGKLIMRDGKYGRFIGCSNYPDCRYTKKSRFKMCGDL